MVFGADPSTVQTPGNYLGDSLAMKIPKAIAVLALGVSCQTVWANSVTGTITTMQIYGPWRTGFVQLSGAPQFDGGGCPNVWASGSLDDDIFMIYIWTALVNAKNHSATVTIDVNGCVNGYPKIDWVNLL
jgi:hypothetical protein